MFQSFGFKHGLPMDADYVFDVRMLPNPLYEPELRHLTGKDAPVQDVLAPARRCGKPCKRTSRSFSATGCPRCSANHRSYVTVAVGCTGGQRRSVYLSEQLAQQFPAQWTTLLRHREMDSRALARHHTLK